MIKNFLFNAAMITSFILFNPETVFSQTSCGSAKILSGDSCESIQVEFDLSTCLNSDDFKRTPAKMNCKGRLKFAEVNKNGINYRALVTFGVNAWSNPTMTIGMVEFVAKKVKTDKPIAESPKPVVEVESVREVFIPLDPPKSPVVVSGFVDAQMQQSSRQGLNRSFYVNDGAIYFSREEGTVDFKLDLPFRMYTTGSADFEFAKTKAQAYVGEKKASGFRYRIGQFDTPYGFEVNDTVDVIFSRQGNTYNFTDPFVHTGVLLGWDFTSEWGVNVVVGSPNDVGAMTGKTPQFGAQVVKTGSERFTLGFLANREQSVNLYNYYIDATAGINLGKFTLDFEFNVNRSFAETHPGTANGAVAAGTLLPAGVSFLFQGIYSFNHRWSAGTRIENLRNWGKLDPRDSNVAGLERQKSQWLIFVGPQLNVTQNFRLKFDYSYQSDLAFTGANYTNNEPIHGFNFAGVYRF